MKRALTFWVLLTCGSSGCGPPAPSLSKDESGWWIYRNAKFGYQIAYPDGYELWATVKDGERDGRSIRIGMKEYAAPTPVLDIELDPAATLYEMATAGEPLKDMRVEVSEIEIDGSPAQLIEYRWKNTGDLSIVEIDGQEVLFRFHAQPGLRKFEKTIWWEIISSFEFTDGP